MNLEEISIIENYVQENLLELIRKDKTYSPQAQNFKFLPGHKAALIALPDIVNEYVANYEESNLKSKPKKNTPEHTTQVLETLEINFTKEKEQSLKLSLIKKVEKFGQNILKISDLKLPEKNISSLDVCFNKAGEIIQKCSVLCPKCEARIACIFNEVWQVSNLEKHLKDCFLGGETGTNPIENSVAKTTETLIIEKPIQANEDELIALLEETNVD